MPIFLLEFIGELGECFKSVTYESANGRHTFLLGLGLYCAHLWYLG